ncbi:MAG: hypothetical protein K6L80_16380 [Agarilytica sp.]
MATQYHIAIIVKLFSVFLFLMSLKQLTYAIEFLISGTFEGMVSTFWLPTMNTLPWLGVSIVLWFFPVSVAKKIVPVEDPQEITPVTSGGILTVLLCALSVYFIYYAIVDSMYWFTLWQLMGSASYIDAPVQFTAENKANIYATLLELVFSVLLLINAKTAAGKISALAK